MAKQPVKAAPPRKSFIEDMTEKLSAGVKKVRQSLSDAPPIGSTGRYGAVSPRVPGRKKELIRR